MRQAFFPIDLKIYQMSILDMRLMSSKVGLCVNVPMSERDASTFIGIGWILMTRIGDKYCDGKRDAYAC